jgi:hypothetical protein
VIRRGMGWERACKALEKMPEGCVVRIDAAWCAPPNSPKTPKAGTAGSGKPKRFP